MAHPGWLDLELERVWLIAERCLRRWQAAELRVGPEHPGCVELEAILAARRFDRNAADVPANAEELEAALASAEARVAANREATPLGHLVRTFGLRWLEIEALLLSLAPHVDADLNAVYQVLRGDSPRNGVDLALVTQLLDLDRQGRLVLLDVLDPARPLLAWQLVQIGSVEGAASYLSASYRPIQPSFDLISFLAGRAELSPLLTHCAQLAQEDPADLVLEPEVAARIDVLTAACRPSRSDAEPPWFLLWGPRGAGKRTVATRIACRSGRPALLFDPIRVEPGRLDDMVQRAQREALLHGALLYIGPIDADALAKDDRLAVRMATYPGQAAFGIDNLQAPRIHMPRSLQELELGPPGEPLRLELWRRALPDIGAGQVDVAALARTFALTPGEIRESADEALAGAAACPKRLTHAAVRAGIDRRMRNELGELARPIKISARWEDLVLPPDDVERVREFVGRATYNHQVFTEWGFGRRIGYGKGMVALLSGPPGTGKTLLAGLIARELDLDIYQVDLSCVVSKWLGETEKQLARVFDHAQRAHAVLLFDEADSLFGKRTDTETAQDRYANLAVNYLLQRLEQYSGVAVLTTNRPAGLDEALQRRLSLHLRFEMPEPGERERLWRSLLPGEAAVAHDVDFARLAKEFELTGGYIKNVTVRAAFLASGERRAIDMGLLRRAATLELEDMGRVVQRRNGAPHNGLGLTRMRIALG